MGGIDHQQNRRETRESQLQSLDRAFRIVELLYDEDGLRLTEVSDKLDMAKSSTHRYLSALDQNGYVVQEEGVYYPGLRFLTVGRFAQLRKDAYRFAEPKVEQLAERTGDRAEFVVEEHGQGVFVHHEAGENAVTTDADVGTRLPLHGTAAGKAILAFYPDERVRGIVDRHGLAGLTEHTITEKGDLFDELDAVRREGVAYDREEVVPGLHAVGVPVRNGSGEVVGGLSVTGPSDRLTGNTLTGRLPELLRGVAKELELNLTYS